MRKNRNQAKAAPYENSYNLPLNKSHTSDHPNENKSGSTYYTPSRDTMDYKVYKKLEDSSYNRLSS